MESGDVANGILAESHINVDQAKIKALKRLDIDHTEDTPLNSWLKHLSELNNVPFTKPAHRDIVDAIQNDISIMRFLFWLA